MIKTFAHKGLEASMTEMHTMSITSTTTELPPVQDRTRAPTHPGEIIKHHHMIPLSLSVTALAEVLGVSRKTVSKIVNERGAVTADMALRLSRAFDTTPQLWMGLQQNYALWHAANDSSGWQTVEPVASSDLSARAAS